VPTAQQINGVFMTSATTAYAVTNYLSGFPDVIKTTDGGATWTALSPDASLAYNLLAVTFATPSVGYITGNSGVVLKTTDAGATWVRQTTPTTLAINSAAFADASTGWVVGASGLVLRTRDGGTTWSVQQSGTTIALRGAAFTDTNHGWIVGAGGTLLRTTNQTPPVTALTTAPSSPDGANGWYTSAPLITLSSNIPATTYYSWTSAAGPFSAYAAPVPAPEGAKTLYYYSVDPGNNVEAVRSSAFKCDYTAPLTPVAVSPGTPTTSTVALSWSPSADAVSGVARYDVYVGGTYRTSSATTSVVPEPAKGSTTRSPGFDEAAISRSMSASGFCVGCAVFSAMPLHRMGRSRTSRGLAPSGCGRQRSRPAPSPKAEETACARSG